MSLLATSRAPLRLALEHRVVLESLSGEDAVGLFMALAREADPRAALDDRPAIDAVCRAVDGLPLALELAAARLRLLSPSQLATRLGSPADLRSAAPDLPDRQRSLRATVDWSLGLLSPSARLLFARMGVFADAVALEVIETVCGSDLDVVECGAELLDFALLRRDDGGIGLVAALRELARERLSASGEEQRIRRAHAIAVIATAEQVGPLVTADGARRRRVLAMLAESRQAVAWARTTDPHLHIRLTTLYATLWGFTEGRLREALDESSMALDAAAAGASSNEEGELLFARCQLMLWVGRAQEGRELAERAAALVRNRTASQTAEDLVRLSIARSAAGAHTAAVEAASEAIPHARAAADQAALVRNLAYVAQALMGVGDLDAAAPVLDEAEALVKGTDMLLAHGLSNFRAEWALGSGDTRRALAGYANSLSGSLRLGELGLALWDSAGIVIALAELNDPAAALEAATLLTLAATEQGADVGALRHTGATVPEVLAAAQAALPDDTAARIVSAADEVPNHERLEYILLLATSRQPAGT